MDHDARYRFGSSWRASAGGLGASAAAAGPLPPPRLAGASFAILLNRRAHGGAADELAAELRRQCDARGIGARLWELAPDRDLRAQVEGALDSGPDVVVAAGGDGTVSTVASCVAGTTTPMGVLALGTLNHFAKDLGVPADLGAALDVLVHGTVAQVDVAQVNGRVFVNNSSLGLYPQIVRHRELQQRRLGRGKWRALVTACWHALATNEPLSVALEVDGATLRRRTGFVFVGNNEYRIDGLRIGERTTLSGGRLSLYVTRRTDPLSMLSLAWRALTQHLRDADDFEALEAGTVVVHTGRRRLRVALDGEVEVMEAPLRYRIRPGALRVVVPA